MQNIDGFDNLAAAIVEETPTSSEQRGEAAERSDMSHVNTRSSTKSSNYDYHRRNSMSTIMVTKLFL